jgi:hypothetical protein
MSGDVGRALLASLVWAAVLQLVAYGLVRLAGRGRLMLAWAGGAAVRLAGLVLYALLVVPAFGLPLTAALLSLAVLLFVSTLIESYLLNRVAS